MLKNCKVDFLGNSEVAFFFIHHFCTLGKRRNELIRKFQQIRISTTITDDSLLKSFVILTLKQMIAILILFYYNDVSSMRCLQI